MISYGELRGRADVWPAVIDRTHLLDSQFQQGVYFDDCAKAGNWNMVIQTLDSGDHLVDVNQSRPASKSHSTVLHRAAESGASAEVIGALLERGAYRSLRDDQGRTAFDLAGGDASPGGLGELLRPEPSPLDSERIAELNAELSLVLDSCIQPLFPGIDLKTILRYPPVEVLHESATQQLWVQLPVVAGGFRVTLCRGYLDLLIGYRSQTEAGKPSVTASGFVITHRGSVHVYETPRQRRSHN